MKKFAVILLALIVACSGQQKKEGETEKAETKPIVKQEANVEYARTEAGNPIVTIKTTMGDMDIEVFENDCPIHAKNFLKLVNAEYYDDVVFHRVIHDFMIQTGDQSGTGDSGPGYVLEPEPVKYKNLRSYVAMAQSGGGVVNGSQFYIIVKDSPHLDNMFPCFAKVISGMDVADNISKVKTDDNDRPMEEIKIISAAQKIAGNAPTTNAEPAAEGK